jgi:DNA modification methylase
MSPTFIRKVIGDSGALGVDEVLSLLDQDVYAETFIPRSRVIDYLQKSLSATPPVTKIGVPNTFSLHQGDSVELLDFLKKESVNCVVTSPPYWGTRLYDYSHDVRWSDGEVCPYGHEQTPEGYIRHTVEMLVKIKRALTLDGSIWWNVMDTFNTRTQIRSNAAEALRAMQGKDKTSWGDYECRRYSAGHAFLKDGEQCGIPGRIAERASRIGLFVKTMITWAKTGSMPEPQNSRVSRNIEYILHLSKHRTPFFQKDSYRTTTPRLGGRSGYEADKLTDYWFLSTSSGKDGHGAQFSLALPGRCISLSTIPTQVVLDPFTGGGTSGIAALQLGRKFIGFDVSDRYLALAKDQITGAGLPNENQNVLALGQA